MKRPIILMVAVLAALLTSQPIATARDLKMLRVGDVSLNPVVVRTRVAFLKRMEELGYKQGRNFIYEYVRVPNRAEVA
jgi:hypothetical protein